MDSLKLLQEQSVANEESLNTEEKSMEACRHNQIDEETLIDIIHFSSESWENLDENLHEQRDHAKLQKYYIDLAMYNRKLELLKMGYYDVFEPCDETIFQDRLVFSLETSLSLKNQMEAAEDRDSSMTETDGLEGAVKAEESNILSSITRFFFPQVCFQ